MPQAASVGEKLSSWGFEQQPLKDARGPHQTRVYAHSVSFEHTHTLHWTSLVFVLECRVSLLASGYSK